MYYKKQHNYDISTLYRVEYLEKKKVKPYSKFRLKEFGIFFPSSKIQAVHWIIIIICQQEAKDQDIKTDHTFSQTKPWSPNTPQCLEKEAPKIRSHHQVDSIDSGIPFLYFVAPRTNKNTHTQVECYWTFLSTYQDVNRLIFRLKN